MMDPDSAHSAATGLARYVASIAVQLGDSVLGIDHDPGRDVATAMIFIDVRVPTVIELPVLLAWDEVNGWALRVQLDDDGDTTALAYLGSDVLPSPEEVRSFAQEAVLGNNPGILAPPSFREANGADGFEQRLAAFA